MPKRINENKTVDENVDQSRRRLTQMAWTTPMIAAITLPAHAQASATTTISPTTTAAPTTTMAPTTLEYFSVLHSGNGVGPQQMSVVVDSSKGMSTVIALNFSGNVRPEIQLNIDGTPNNSFSGDINPACGGVSLPGASWFISGYTLGDPTISVTTTGGSWTATLPLGAGSVAATCTT